MGKKTEVIVKGLGTGLLVWSVLVTAATPDVFNNTHDKDDYEMALFRDDANPAVLCEYGTHNRRFHSPASACRAAYETAMKSSEYTRATRYAALGCEAYGDRGLCQAMPKIPFPSAQVKPAPK